MSSPPKLKRSRQPCRSCKHHHIKCEPDCSLSPYFPAHMKHQYKNAQKVFGDMHMKRLLKSLEHVPHKQSTAMKHLVFQANMRVADLARGCSGLINTLQQQIAQHEEELRLVRHQLSLRLGGGAGGGLGGNVTEYGRNQEHKFQDLITMVEQGHVLLPHQEQSNFARGCNLHQEQGNMVDQKLVQPKFQDLITMADQVHVLLSHQEQRTFPRGYNLHQEQGDMFDGFDQKLVIEENLHEYKFEDLITMINQGSLLLPHPEQSSIYDQRWDEDAPEEYDAKPILRKRKKSKSSDMKDAASQLISLAKGKDKLQQTREVKSNTAQD